MPPTLTVCIPNYNHGRYIGQTLESVLSQSLPPEEIIVIDDASTDDSIAVVERYAQRYPSIRLVTKPVNRGVFDSVAMGLSIANGEFFYLLSADDYVLPGFFEKAISLLEKYPRAGMCAVAIRFVDPEGDEVRRQHFPAFHTHMRNARDSTPFLDPTQVLERLKRQPWFLGGVAAVLFRREVFAESGGLIAELGQYSDWFAPHFVALKYGMCYMPEVMVAFRLMPESFGTKIATRPRQSLEHAAATLRLLSDPRYADVFPRQFVRLQRKHFTYGAFRGALVLFQTTFFADLQRLVPSQTWMGRTLTRLMRLALAGQWLLLKVYCYQSIALDLRERVSSPARGLSGSDARTL